MPEEAQLGIEWDCAPIGTSFTVFFPGKKGAKSGYSLLGVWKITKIEPFHLVRFNRDKQELTIPHPLECAVEATATSETSPYTYYLTRGDVRDILKWAQKANPEEMWLVLTEGSPG